MKRWLFRVARLSALRPIVRWVFAHMSFLIPVQRLRETETLIAFHHPQPSYPFHVLLVAKHGYTSLLDVPPQATDFLCDLIETVQSLVREFQLESGGYRLIANGGSYQDVPQLHFHLIADVHTESECDTLPARSN
jgi:histidine triad (HIT) family protein